MAKSFGQYLKKNLLSIITLIAVLITLFSYFNVYIPARQKELNASQFRVLIRLNKNLSNKYDALDSLKSTIFKNTSTEMANHEITYHIENAIADINKNTPAITFKLRKYKYADSVNYNRIDSSKEEIIKYYTIHNNRTDSVYKISSEFNWANFADNLLRKDFTSYLIINNNNLIYNSNPFMGISFSALSAAKDSILKKSLSLNLNNKNSFDTLFTGDYPALISSTVKNINIGGEDYKLFILPIKNLMKTKKTRGNGQFLCGLMPAAQYNATVRLIPDNVLYLITLALIFFLLFLPFIKLLLINEVERVVTQDIIVAIMCMMTGATLITVSYLFWHNDYYQNSKQVDEKSRQIAEAIKHNFKSEIDSACLRLQRADVQSHSKELLKDTSIYINPADSTFTFYNNKLKQTTDSEKLITSFNWQNDFDSSYNSFYWLDNSGSQVKIWVRDKKNLVGGDYRTRQYFKDIQNNIKNYLPFLDKCDNDNFCIEPVVSWTTGTQRTVISTKSKSQNPVVCVSINPVSISGQFIPLGYGYSIIDKYGNVMYSSDSTRNLNENLFEECTDSSNFTAAVHSRTKEQFTANYHGEPCSFIIEPISGMPYYITVYSKNLLGNQRIEHVMFFTYTCTISLFLFIVLLIILIATIKERSPHLKTTGFQLDWLWPLKSKGPDYFLTLLFNVLVIGLTWGYIKIMSNCPVVYSNYSVFLLYIMMIEVLFVTGYVFFKFNTPNKGNSTAKERNWIRITFIIIALLLVIVAHSTYNIGGYVLLYTFILVLLYCLFEYKGFVKFFEIRKTQTVGDIEADGLYGIKWLSETNLCTAVFLSWLFISCIIPSCYFTKYSYDQINIRQLKNYQIHYTKKFLIKRNNPGNGFESFPAVVTSSARQKGLTDAISMDKSVRKPAATDNFYQYIMCGIKPLITPAFNNTLYLGENTTDDAPERSYIWTMSNNDTILNLTNGAFDGKENKCNYHLSIASPIYRFSFNNGNCWTKMVSDISFLIFLAIGFLFVRFWIRRLFTGSHFNNEQNKTAVKAILNNPELYNRVFMNGLPFCGKYDFIEDLFTDPLLYSYNVKTPTEHFIPPIPFIPKQKALTIDLLIIPDVASDLDKIDDAKLEENFKISDSTLISYNTIILTHFEYNFYDRNTSRLKLSLIEKLIRLGKRVIIFSDIDPVSFLESHSDFDKYISKEESKQIEQEMGLWAILLGGFYNVYYHSSGINSLNEFNPGTDKAMQQVWKECSFGTFMPSIARQLSNPGLIKPETNKDEIIWRVQTQAHLYYHSLWNFLTKEEQYLVYDIAQDGLFNSKNMHTADALLAKGLLVRLDGKIQLMNESFRNFILTEIKKEEILIIESDIADQGRWSSFRTPILIVVAAVVIFIISSEQDSFHNILSYLTMFLTGISLLQKVLTAFDGVGAKE